MLLGGRAGTDRPCGFRGGETKGQDDRALLSSGFLMNTTTTFINLRKAATHKNATLRKRLKSMYVLNNFDCF